MRQLLLVLLLTAAAWASPVGYDYHLEADPTLHQVKVVARLLAECHPQLWLEGDIWPFVSGFEQRQPDGTWLAIQDRRLAGPGPWTFRYTLDLRAAAETLDDFRNGCWLAPALLTSPRSLLIQPKDALEGHDFRLTVADPAHFACGVTPAGPGVYQAATRHLDACPAAVFGQFAVQKVGPLELVYEPGGLELSDRELIAWVQQCVDGLTAYFHRFPVPRALLVMLPHPGQQVFGTAIGGGGASVIVSPGRTMPAAELRQNWTLMHELSHLGLPSLPREHHWLEEGFATYIEPIVRSRAGDLTPREVWTDFYAHLPAEWPSPDDWRHHRYQKIYYGGALFWMLADLRIRLATHNEKSLDDGLRAIVAKGGNLAQDWPLEEIVRTVDGAVGQPVLAKLRKENVHLNLKHFWGQLGVTATALKPGPWAYLRDSICSSTSK